MILELVAVFHFHVSETILSHTVDTTIVLSGTLSTLWTIMHCGLHNNVHLSKIWHMALLLAALKSKQCTRCANLHTL